MVTDKAGMGGFKVCPACGVLALNWDSRCASWLCRATDCTYSETPEPADRAGYVVRVHDGGGWFYLQRGPEVEGSAGDYLIGDSLADAAIFATPGVARGIARAAIAPAYHANSEVVEAKRTIRLGPGSPL